MPDIVNQWPFSHHRIKEDNPGMWQDFYVEGRPFGKVYGYYNDFSNWIADSWTITEVGTSLQRLSDARNGVLELVTGGTENDGNNCQLGGSADSETVGESFLPAAGKNLWFECRVASDLWTQHEVFLGLSIQDTSVAESRGADYIGFRSTDGSAVIDSQAASTASGASVVAGVVTPTDSITSFQKLGFKVTGTDKIEFYVNEVIAGTLTTSIPTTEMKLTMAHTAGDAAAHTLGVDYICCFQDR